MSPKAAPVVIVPPDPGWPAVFQALRECLAEALGSLGRTIHHVGSTAVDGLAAKPILDVVIEMPSRAVLPDIVEVLVGLGYTHEGDKGVHQREAFRQQDGSVPRWDGARSWMRHHLYACARDNRALREHLVFRDWLRAHPEDRDAYARLKTDLAVRFGTDREGYTEAKGAFVSRVLARASSL